MPEAAERKALGEGLKHLDENMRTVAELGELALRKAVVGLDGDPGDEAAQVFAIDREIYGLKQEIVKECVELIALHAPVAGDLRTITASLEITTDVDRIGRYSKDIAEVVQELDHGADSGLDQLPELRQMGERTIAMIHRSLTSFLNREHVSVPEIIRADDEVDRLHDIVFRKIIDGISARAISPRIGAHLILVNRYLERLSDHAVNIGGHVAYMVTGDLPEPMPRPHEARQTSLGGV